MDNALQALRQVDFDWTAHIDQIWNDGPADVSSLQVDAREELDERLVALNGLRSVHSPLGIPLLGAAGAGKTHLLGVLRRRAITEGHFFVLVDMTDVRDFWEIVGLGYLRSLQKSGKDGRRQLDNWLTSFIAHFGAKVKKASMIPQQRPPGLINTCNDLISAVRNEFREETQEHEDVLRALVLLACDDAEINDLGYKWLQGIGIDDDERHHHGFREARRSPQRVVRGLSWLLSLQASTVLALDQFDAIVAEHNLASSIVAAEPTEQQQASLAIIQGIAGGLIALRDVTRRSLIVVSTLQATWKILETRVPVSMTDRFESPIHLDAANSPEAVKHLVLGRLQQAYTETAFKPPYPTFPFQDSFFEKYHSNTPREVLKVCDSHRHACKKAGKIDELGDTKPTIRPPSVEPNWSHQIQSRIAELEPTANIQKIFEDESERELDILVETACTALILENELPDTVIARVDKDFLGTGSYDLLHARVRLVLTDQNERERHHSFRFLQKSQYRAFQSRLKAAITASGIDHSLKFRRLTILRCGAPPGGAATQALLKELEDRGGQMVEPSESELRTLWALSQLLGGSNEPTHLDDWLRENKPVSRMPSFSVAAKWLFEELSKPVTVKPIPIAGPKAVDSASIGKAATVSPSNGLPIGRRVVSGRPEDVVVVGVDSLTNHTCVFAGSGSGKTVFLRRIVEEAALLGVPSIVLDGANDLSRLGDRWPERPSSWTDEDAQKAERYHAVADVVVWTPGLTSGNPLVFNPIPDFASMITAKGDADSRDQLNAAVSMARSSLEPLVAPGKSAKDKKSSAILAAALQRFAEQGGGSMRNLIEMLRDPPDDVVEGYQGGEKIAQEISELLLSATKTDALLRSEGSALDPALLLHSSVPGKVRISVINLSGLPGQETQQKFVNQLAMTLFTWIKKNPPSGGVPSGLLIIDEAKDFVPSGKSVPSKDNLNRLAAQARKYGLGLLFATQAPKSIDHNIVANCSTLLVGKTNSPAAIAAVQQLLIDKGGPGNDVAKLATGNFYLSTSAHPKPTKIATSLCLSHHPATPPDENGVLERARRNRVQ